LDRKAFFILPFILLSLILGAYNGLIRIGWDFPLNQAVAQHGAIMVGSFLCTYILLARTVILKNRWLYIFPALNGLSVIFFLTGNFLPAMQLLFIGSVALAGIFIYLYSMYRKLYMLIMLIGTISLVGGDLMLINSHFYPASVSFWFAFILLIVTGERLELTKFLPAGKNRTLILLIGIILYFAGLFFNYHGSGHWLTGFSMLIFATWLLAYDIAFKSLKHPGQHRYIAVNLIAAYGWLMISGFLLFLKPDLEFIYDATIHSFLLGFTFSMIFAHGTIILPGIVKSRKKPFHPLLYLWTILLHVSILMRMAGDFTSLTEFRAIAGLINMIAISGYFIHVLAMIRPYEFKRNKTQPS
jgi:hypothetical protein